MKIEVLFDRAQAEVTVAMALGAPIETTKKMSDDELLEKALRFAATYGFSAISKRDGINQITAHMPDRKKE